MFKLIPQLIVIISIITVIVIILRRVPQVTVRQDSAPIMEGAGSVASRFSIFLRKIKIAIIGLYRYLKSFILEAKNHTAKTNYLERFSRALHLKSVKSQLQKSTEGVSEHLSEAAEHVQKNDFESAEQSLLKIIEKDPGNKDAYESLGKLYIDQEKFADAVEVYEHLTSRHPENDNFFSRLAKVHFNLKNYDMSIRAYQKAVDIKPDSPNRLINLGLCYEAKGEYVRAIESAEKALSLSPDNPKYMLVLADFLVAYKKKELAKGILEKVLELEPTNETARDRLNRLKF